MPLPEVDVRSRNGAIMAVSYTHLDVYKRQLIERVAGDITFIILGRDLLDGYAVCTVSVSYTHLTTSYSLWRSQHWNRLPFSMPIISATRW